MNEIKMISANTTAKSMLKDGVFSLWKGHNALTVLPFLKIFVVRPIRSDSFMRFRISSRKGVSSWLAIYTDGTVERMRAFFVRACISITPPSSKALISSPVRVSCSSNASANKCSFLICFLSNAWLSL